MHCGEGGGGYGGTVQGLVLNLKRYVNQSLGVWCKLGGKYQCGSICMRERWRGLHVS